MGSVLSTKIVSLQVDESSGRLVALTSKMSGWNIMGRAELARSFRMYVPIPGRRNNQVIGERQAPPRCESGDASIQFTWDGLESEHGGRLDISFTARIFIVDDAIAFESQLENRSPHTVEAVQWPIVGDMTIPPGASRVTRMNLVYGGMGTREVFPRFANDRGYFGVDHPIQMVATPEAPFVLLDSEAEGLYVGYHEKSAEQLMQFTLELKPGYEFADGMGVGTVGRNGRISGQPTWMELYTTHFPYCASGESSRLRRVVVRSYRGGWQKGADLYKAWRKATLNPPASPAWVKEVHSWQQIQINSPEDELRCSYRDLVKYGEDCRKHGVDAIQLVGWSEGGQDRAFPSHDTDPRLGTEEELKEAIRAIQAMGVKVVLFNKFTWADRAEEWFRKELVKYAVKDPHGDCYVYGGYMYQTPMQLSDINTRRLIPMCHLSGEWRRIARTEFLKGVELGAAGMLYDESQHHSPARYCFDPSHGHHVPAHVFAGDNVLAGEFRAVLPESARDYLIAGEACYDLELEQYSLSYFRVGWGHIPLHRYVNPDAEMMIGCVGYNDRNTINLALLYRYVISYEPRNFKGRLDEFPETIEYGRKVDALRKRYSSYLWKAEYRGTVGVVVSAGGKHHEPYAVFVSRETGKRAVVVVNQDISHGVSVKVEAENMAGQPLKVSPEAPVAEPSDGTAQIPPMSAVVFLEK